jgi:hypothetical protein
LALSLQSRGARYVPMNPDAPAPGFSYLEAMSVLLPPGSNPCVTQ